MKNFLTVALLSMALFGSAVAGDKACCDSKKEAKADKACCAKKSAKAKKDCCSAKVAVEYCKSDKCGWFAESKKGECGTCMDKVSNR